MAGIKKTDEPKGITFPVRLTDADVARLDALAACMPMTTRSALAREALRRGVELFEAALKEPTEAGRLAALAKLCGMTTPKTKP